MRFNPLTWKTRNCAYSFIAIVVFYMFFMYKKLHQVSVDIEIEQTKPEHVWEYVADFSNMLHLNPTLEDFNILNESGTYDHWKYSIHYKEHLSQIPSIKHSAVAHYSIRPEGDSFIIESQHETCFFFNCVNSASKFEFASLGEGTKCTEFVEYECPIVFSNFCRREVMYQREEIAKRLKIHFSSKNKQ